MNKRLIVTTIAAAAAATQLFATEGINLIGIGPVQQGTAGAGVASAKDSTWLILNPAGLVDLQPSADVSLQVFAPVRTVSGPSAMGNSYEDDSMFVIPSLSGSFGCCHGENGFVGLGVYGTSGMGVEYGPTALGSMTELSIAKMTTTYAYRAGDSGFSIGAGPIFVLSRFKTDMMGTSGDWDTSYGAGAIVGVNQKIGRLSVGGSYMSEQFMSQFDRYDGLLAHSLNLPQQLTVGAAFNVLDNVELALDYRWTGWKELDTFGDQFGWDNQNIVKAGVTWGVNDALTLRGGISHGNSPIPEAMTLMNSLFPAIVETHAALGVSYALDKVEIHVTYVHAFEATQTDPNGMPAIGGNPALPAGTSISMYQNSLTAGLTYTF